MNPVEAFLSEHTKQAAPEFLTNALQHMPEQMTQGVAMGAAGAAIAGAGVGVGALYHAITKGRNFRKMLEFNEDLAERHQGNPKYVNAAFSTLHRMNPSFAADPMVAGAYVRQMVEQPNAAFGQAGMAAGYAPRPSAVQDAALGGLGAGLKTQPFGRQVDTQRMETMFKGLGQREQVPSGSQSPPTRPEGKEDFARRVREISAR